MNSDQVMSLIRAILTTGGGFLVAKGVTDAATVATAAGALSTLIGVVWSMVVHKKKTV